MPINRLVRPVLALGLLALGGCVGAPAPGVAYGQQQAYLSNNCFAGFYQCVLPQAGQAGTPCACPGIGAPSYGTIR